MSDLWLDPDDVEHLTAKKRWSSQCRTLAQMGIPFLANAVGRPLVERSVVVEVKPQKRTPSEPNWNALKNLRQRKP